MAKAEEACAKIIKPDITILKISALKKRSLAFKFKCSDDVL